MILRSRGHKTLLEAGLQVNFVGHIKEYGRIAKERNNLGMLVVFYSINALVVFSVFCFICGIFVIILP